jgi:membrane protease YdiL (CAAX protease family)
MLSAKPWRTDAVFFFLGVQACCFFFGSLAIALLQKAGVAGFKDMSDPGCILLGTLCMQGATWVLMGIFFYQNDISWREALGFQKGNLLSSLLLAFATVVLVLFVALWLQSITVELMEKMHWKAKDEAAVTLLSNVSSPAMEIYLTLFTVVIAPVAEEFIFRGVLYPFIKQLGYPKTALIGVSLLFAFIHWDVAIFIPLFLLALALTWLYEKTDNLMAPIFAHALFNGINLTILDLQKFFPHWFDSHFAH